MICGENGLKYPWTLHFRSCFNLASINPSKTPGLGKTLHIFAASMGTLQMLTLVWENSPFPQLFLFS